MMRGWPLTGYDTSALVRRAAILAALAATYSIAGKFGLTLAVSHPNATPVWPPSGIALAAFLLIGYWVWPAVFLAACFVNVTTAGSLLSSIGIATGNTMEGFLGAYLVNRLANGRLAFVGQRDTFLFVLLAAGLSTTVSATIGVTSLSLTGYADWQRFGEIWLTWWLGDAAGALIVTPVIVLWVSQPTVTWSRNQLFEIGALLH